MPGGAPSSDGADGGSIYERGDVEGRRGWVCTFSLLLTAGAIEKIIAITCVSAESLAALSITGDATISTLPASSRQLGAALASAPASFLMARVGRRLGFIVGGSLGLGGSLVCALALVLRSFPLLCLGTTFVGVESGFAGYAKYVAAQVVPPRHKTRAISLSITSSVFAGVVAPRLTQFSQGMLPGAPFAATFLLLAAIAVLFGCLTALNTGLPGKPTPTEEAAAAAAAKAVTGGVSVRQLLRNPGFVAAVASQSGGYFAMIFTMTSCPLAMAARGIEYPAIATTISAHAVSMFLPGLVTGDVIRHTSCATVMSCGVLLYAVVIGIALHGETTAHFIGALACIGLGWNFIYTSGSALLVKSVVAPAERSKAQAIAETTTQIGNLSASLASGVVINNIGWRGVALLTTVPLAMCAAASLAALRMECHADAEERPESASSRHRKHAYEVVVQEDADHDEKP